LIFPLKQVHLHRTPRLSSLARLKENVLGEIYSLSPRRCCAEMSSAIRNPRHSIRMVLQTQH